MDQVLVPVKHFCRAYLDDLLTHATTFEEYCEHLRILLLLLIDLQLLASFSKSCFMVQEVSYLGHLLTADGIRMDPAKIQTIMNLQPPHDVASLQHVLGYSNTMPSFIPTMQVLRLR